ncbi:MAG: hypothetical protein EBR30_10755 [Cytophagia bacterium]|nr:hypothetical protein [Cytophagia bacterium]
METYKKGKLGNGNEISRIVKMPKGRSLVIDEFHSVYIRHGVETNVMYVGELSQCLMDSSNDDIIAWYIEGLV